MKNICIIPAKGTSKRMPGKNIKPFIGRPVIEYTLNAVRESGCFEKIIVSTDDDKIGSMAAREGAIYDKRDMRLCGDLVPMVEVITDYLERDKTKWDTVCMAYPCSPFIESDTIKKGYERYAKGDIKVVTSVYASAEHAEYSMLIRDDVLESRYPEHKDTNSQLFPATFQPAGQFYIADVEYLMLSMTFTPREMAGVIVPHGIDIDTEYDWRVAEAMYLLDNKPDALDWLLGNTVVMTECQEMAERGYGSLTLHFQDGALMNIDRSVRTRTEVTKNEN